VDLGKTHAGTSGNRHEETSLHWPLARGPIRGDLFRSYCDASFGIKLGKRSWRALFLGTATVSGLILLYPSLRNLLTRVALELSCRSRQMDQPGDIGRRARAKALDSGQSG